MTWQKVKLGDVCEIISGSTPKTGVAEYWGDEIWWATPKDLSRLDSIYIDSTEKHITRAGMKSCSTRLLPAGSVLFSSRAPIGHVAINSVPVCTNQGFKSFIPNEQRAHNKYLYFWLRANRDYLDGLGNGATFREVSKTTVERVEIPLPPIEEQKRLAAILDRADELRRVRRESLARLDELAQSLFLELFGDPATNPKGLIKETLGQLTRNITDGKHGDCRPALNSGYFFVSVKDIKDGRINYSDSRQIERDDFMEVHKRTRLEAGDVLITNSGTIGKTAIIAASPQVEKTTFQKSVAIIKPRREILESHYLKTALDLCVTNLSRESSGSSQKNLLLSQLRNFSICVPAIELQQKFSEQIEELEAIKIRARTSLTELDALFASLQSRAFAGELSGEA